MKTKLFISFATFVAASVLMSSCSIEERADRNDQLTAFTGGIVTEVPMERVQIGTPDGSTVVSGFTTRTFMNRDAIGGQGAFLWEPNDVIYVKDDNNKLCKSLNTITESAPRTTFLVDGSYTGKNQYDVYYYGTNSGAGAKKVVIADNQTQVAFNNTKHFGVAGDCGVATATKATVAGKSGYRFDLKHKVSYLCFLPYIPSQQERANYKFKSIEITSNNNISGTYDLTESGLSGTGNAKKITLNIGTDGKGLKLADQTTAAKSIKNSLYVVIAPGTRKLSVKYTVFDTKGNKVMTQTKNYKSHNFTTNGVCDIPVSLGSADLNGGHKNADSSDTVEEDKNVFRYSGHNYYMWDAAKNYWSGHEWDAAVPWQPIKNDETNDGYPKSKSADGARWYHEGSGSFEASVNPLFKQLPNANEMAWYVLKGDARYDISSYSLDRLTGWEVFGTVYSCGIWLKKLSVIAQENNKKLVELKQKDPNGNDLRKSYKNYWVNLEDGKPSNSEIDNYFFLPALGCYYAGELNYLGHWGYYWSSSANPGNSSYAYYLFFDYTTINVKAENGRSNDTGKGRGNGFVAQPFK